MHFPQKSNQLKYSQIYIQAIIFILIGIVPVLIAMKVLGLWHWDLSIPLFYSGADDVWQLLLTKILHDTGWILETSFLGAPDVAHWQYHAAAQTSALHSVFMLFLSCFIDDSIRLQQIYYIMNFSLISISSYMACRLLKISKIFSVSVAILFSFTSFRICWMFYAFLSNYFAVPLSLVPIFWILTVQYPHSPSSARITRIDIIHIFRSRKFWISLVCILLVTLSDGYYAFFTLLLLGFATFMRICYGDIKTPIRLLSPFILIFTLILVSFVISLPLSSYKHEHHKEFDINGQPDPLLIKHPFESEVYSSSLKLLIAPIPEHHIRKLGEIGYRIIKTSDSARKYPSGKPIVSLGSIGSLLFLSSLVLLALLLLQQSVNNNNCRPILPAFLKYNPVLWAAVLLSLFVFLCSISGGIGTLVALVFPTIRAYDRFPLYLIFCLFVGAGSAITALIKNTSQKKTFVVIVAAIAFTLIGLYDQIPYNAIKCSAETKDRFLAERKFVENIEQSLNTGAMIYQYPHSQYLSENKYYGWGSFSHIRLYLHSTGLHWSNGASKNSAVEKWHERISELPINELITEVEAAGFRGFVIDCSVVPENEFQKIKEAFNNLGVDVSKDVASALAFVKLKDPGYQIIYNNDFRSVKKVIVTDKAKLSQSKLSSQIKEEILEKILFVKKKIQYPITIERSQHPEIFNDFESILMGYGFEAIKPVDRMIGQMSCKIEGKTSVASKKDIISIILKNKSEFNWCLGRGKYPINIGLHLKKLDGTLIQWDDGFRVPVPADAYIKHDHEVEFRFPLSILDLRLRTELEENATLRAEFTLVQDGHTWFEQISSSLLVHN